MKITVNKILTLLTAIATDIDLAKDTKASEQRARKGLLALEKLGKIYRKESVASRK